MDSKRKQSRLLIMEMEQRVAQPQVSPAPCIMPILLVVLNLTVMVS